MKDDIPQAGYLRLWKLFHALSFDIVIGALSVGIFVMHLMHVNPPPCWYAVLSASIWAIYTTDHLLDGFAAGQTSQMFRHRLHYQNRYLLIALLGITSLYAFVKSLLCFGMPVILGGLILGGLVLIYLFFVYFARKQHFYFHKEFFIALFYLMGIWLAPFIWFKDATPAPLIGVFIILLLLVWIEGLIVAAYDQHKDEIDQQQSFATYYGRTKTQQFIYGLIFLAGFLSLLGFFVVSLDHFKAAFVMLFLMNLLLFVIYFYPSLFLKHGYYRLLGEIVFWLPACILLFW